MLHFGGGEENHEGTLGEGLHNDVGGGPERSMTSEGGRFEIFFKKFRILPKEVPLSKSIHLERLRA